MLVVSSTMEKIDETRSHNFGSQTGNSFILCLWRLARTFKTGLPMCPDLCRKHSLVNSNLIATVTRTRVATHQHRILLSGQFCTAVQWKTRQCLLTSESCGFLKSSEHVSCAHRQIHLQSCTMCLECASSERDLSPPQMRRRNLQASC